MYIFDFFKKTDKPTDKVSQITVKELKEKIKSDDELLIIDVSEPFEFSRRSIENAVNIPLGNFQQSIESGGLKVKDKTDIVVYCAHGIRSLYATKMLINNNYQNVYSLSGGIAAWQKL